MKKHLYLKLKQIETERQHKIVLPQGMDENMNIPWASDTAWHRDFSIPGALPEPWGQSTSKTSSELK